MGRPLQFGADAAVDAAVDLFWRKGFGATTPQELADEIGIGKGSLYNTFKSKQNLYELALRRYSDNRVSALTEGLSTPGPVRPLLRTAMETLAGVGVHQRGCFAVNSIGELAGADKTTAQVAGDLFERIVTALGTAVDRGQRSGELDSRRDPVDVARALLATVVGASVLAKSGVSPDRVKRILSTAIEDV
jgi:TetR/AcrR family transcriptional repressor of nem operon